MKRFCSVAIIFLLTCSLSFGQGDIPLFRYTGNEFKGELNGFVSKHEMLHVYVSNHVAKNNFSIREICHEGVALIRFKFDSVGIIKEIGCSRTTPVQIAKAFKDAVQASQKYWVHRKDVPVNDRWYIQPVIYKFGISCKTKEIDFFSLKGGLFQFDDGTPVSSFDGVILTPWITSSGVDEVH